MSWRSVIPRGSSCDVAGHDQNVPHPSTLWDDVELLDVTPWGLGVGWPKDDPGWMAEIPLRSTCRKPLLHPGPVGPSTQMQGFRLKEIWRFVNWYQPTFNIVQWFFLLIQSQKEIWRCVNWYQPTFNIVQWFFLLIQSQKEIWRFVNWYQPTFNIVQWFFLLIQSQKKIWRFVNWYQPTFNIVQWFFLLIQNQKEIWRLVRMSIDINLRSISFNEFSF